MPAGQLKNIIEADVAVVGGGLSGFCAARQAAGLGARVVLLDKARAGASGPSAFSPGEMICWLPGEDSLGDWIQAYLDAGEGLNSRAWLTMFLEGHYRLVESLASQGFNFLLDGDGNFVRWPGQGPQVKCVLAPMQAFQEKNRQACLALGVTVIDRFCVVELLIRDGRAEGVAGFSLRDGRISAVLARSVVISSGGCSYRGPFFGQDTVAGEGLAMALAAGAGLAYMEYGNHYDVSLAGIDTCGLSGLMARGGRYLNRFGRIFPEKEGHPEGPASGNELARAMVEEVRSGRGPVYADLNGLRDRMLAEKLMPNLKLALDRGGIDLFTGRHEVIPAFTGTSGASPAGIWIDPGGGTSVEGLFAAGDAAGKGLVTGACVGITGISPAWASFTGHLAGRSAAGHARNTDPGKGPRGLEEREAKILSPLEKRNARRPGDILRSLGEEMARLDVGLIRSGPRLASALGKVSTWRWELENLCGSGDPHELMVWYEARGSLNVAEATLLSAMERRESRGGHFREDFPEKDPAFGFVIAVDEINGVKCVRIPDETGVRRGGGGKN